jgi:ubiquinone/menaquinone biosynthesis C-methylase UbiE
MADVHTRIREQPSEVLETIARSMETRASEPAMQAIVRRYLSALEIPNGARALELGCGNGASTRLFLEHLPLGELVGIDPSPAFIEMATEALGADRRARFQTGDARDTGQSDASFDLVLAHTVLSHVPEPERALAEALRLLKPGGQFVVFDGDYATITVALFNGDPLQAAAEAVLRNLVHAPYIMRRLPKLMADAGFKVECVEPHGYVQTSKPEYLLSLLARGVDGGVAAGELGQELAEGFKAEAQRRVEEASFFGAILFLSVVARKP